MMEFFIYIGIAAFSMFITLVPAFLVAVLLDNPDVFGSSAYSVTLLLFIFALTYICTLKGWV